MMMVVMIVMMIIVTIVMMMIEMVIMMMMIIKMMMRVMMMITRSTMLPAMLPPRWDTTGRSTLGSDLLNLTEAEGVAGGDGDETVVTEDELSLIHI